MGKIAILPDTLISQIAAGEVVERPASAVKELIENSIDANATHIAVEIEQGGMKLISIRDNGCGMDMQDARLALQRHATSKISTLEDLSAVKSYGFRGEALAAIASVSACTLRTRQKECNSGFEIIYKGGKLESENVVGCPPGTEITVRNLFFNTPARRKFIKTEQTELGHIMATVSHIALANPSIGFDLRHNGKMLLQTSAGARESRIADIAGKDFLDRALAVSFITPSIKIYGFVSQPGAIFSSKRHQYLFVNGRDVTDSMVSRAVLDAYGSRLPGRAFPGFVLHIDLDPHDVDVNVHPRKMAVKFLETQRIYRDVMQAVSQALDGQKLVSGGAGFGAWKPELNPQENQVQDALNFSQEFASRGDPENFSAERQHSALKEDHFEIIAQIANSYILVLDEEGLAIVDQHAAHERILYERLSSRENAAVAVSQPLLTPLTIECSREEAVFLKNALEALTKIGFEFDTWSGNTFVLRACPSSLARENIEKIFRDFLDGAATESHKEHGKILPEKLLKSLACKAAIKFGMPLSLPEQQQLLRDLTVTPNRATCPHGRPVRVIVTFDELEKRFLRN